MTNFKYLWPVLAITMCLAVVGYSVRYVVQHQEVYLCEPTKTGGLVCILGEQNAKPTVPQPAN